MTNTLKTAWDRLGAAVRASWASTLTTLRRWGVSAAERLTEAVEGVTDRVVRFAFSGYPQYLFVAVLAALLLLLFRFAGWAFSVLAISVEGLVEEAGEFWKRIKAMGFLPDKFRTLQVAYRDRFPT